MKRLLFILFLLPLSLMAQPTTYFWNTTNIGVAITNANYPSIHAGDTIYIMPCSVQAGYRSVVIQLYAAVEWVYSTLDSNQIKIIFVNSPLYPTIKENSSGNLFANSIDHSDNLKIIGLKMMDHTDQLFSSVMATGYLHHVYFIHDTLQNQAGLWGSGPITTSLPNFTGAADTVNCIYDLWFHKCVIDTIGNTSFGGLTVMWFGGFKANQVLVKTTVDSCTFNYVPSPNPSGPGSFIHCQQCLFITIANDSFANLGVVATPEGHAASTFMQMSLYDIHHNFFHANFGDCDRAISQATSSGMAALFTAWDSHYDGVSRFYGNILDSGRKYPMFEDQFDTIGMNGLSYLTPKRSARVWNNTMFRGGAGAGDQYYNVSVFDFYRVAYTVDTLELHNCIEIGPPTDTVATFCTGQGCVALITTPSGAPARYDTANNQFYQLMTFATSGLADSNISPIGFYPKVNTAYMYNNGGVVPSWLTTDFHGKPVPTTGRPSYALNHGVDVGAVQYQSPVGCNCIPIPVGVRVNVISYLNKKQDEKTLAFSTPFPNDLLWAGLDSYNTK